MPNYKTIREEAYEANMLLPKYGLVLMTFGNASAADRVQGVFAIKPSGVAYEKLSPKDMVIVDFESKVVEGKWKPSSDTKTHAVLYSECPEISGVVHTHSTYATAWAQTLTDIPILGTTHADHLTVDIPCAPPMKDAYIKGDYEYNTGYQILDELKKRKLSYKEVEMILVGNHAPFTWGKTIDKAVYNSAVLESIAQMAFISLTIAPKIKRMKKSLIDKHYERKHGGNAYYGQE
ncbi:MAG: L-ribulose-5-phosphate 4-epimerase AraD [Saprospiraceae bacterium]|nr:L-ribulose-5-phosphate 4-epimerase AraD [Saprospiraceae bacterium]